MRSQPKRGVAFAFDLALPSQANPLIFQSSPTLATGDVKVSKDAGALSNLASLPTASGKLVRVSLSDSEMDADTVTVVFSDAAGDEWCDVIVEIHTGSDPALLASTTIATLASQTSFTLTSGSADNNAYIGCRIVFTDAATPTQQAVGRVTAYTGATKTITLAESPPFTIAVGDYVDILAAPVDVNTTSISGDSTAADNLEAMLDGTGGVTLTTAIVGNITGNLSGTVTTVTTVNGFAAGAITAAAVATGAIDADALAADAVAEIQSGLSTLTQTDVTGGAYPISSASFAFHSTLDFTTAQKAATLARVTLTDTASVLTNDPSGVTTLLSRLSASRAGYLDYLNIGGVVASQSDISALNQSASRRILLTTVGQYERPESGSTVYTIESRTFDGDGTPVNADSTPTASVTGQSSGDLSANLGVASNPATGVYRWTYTVANNATIEPVRVDVSATIGGTAFPMSVYTQVVDCVSATWTAGDAAKLSAVYNKLPSRDYLAGVTSSTGSLVTADIGLSVANLDTQLSGLSSDISAIPTNPLTTLGANAPANWIDSGALAASAGTELATAVWANASRTLSAATNITSDGAAINAAAGVISTVNIVNTLTTYTGNTPQTGDSFARIGATGSGLTSLAPANTALSNVTWTNVKAGYLDASISDAASGVLTATMAESYPADGDAASLSQALYLIMAHLNERSVSGTTVVLKKLDGSTNAATLSINDASSPTRIWRTS